MGLAGCLEQVFLSEILRHYSTCAFGAARHFLATTLGVGVISCCKAHRIRFFISAKTVPLRNNASAYCAGIQHICPLRSIAAERKSRFSSKSYPHEKHPPSRRAEIFRRDETALRSDRLLWWPCALRQTMHRKQPKERVIPEPLCKALSEERGVNIISYGSESPHYLGAVTRMRIILLPRAGRFLPRGASLACL